MSGIRKSGVDSGLVMTVLGPRPVEELGVTLMHEHLLFDVSNWWQPATTAMQIRLSELTVDINMIGDLRMHPFLNRDNCKQLDVNVSIEEVQQFRDLGGQTVVDPTTLGMSRDPLALQMISRKTGLNIVMGTGFYLGNAHPEYVKRMSVDDIANLIVNDVGAGENLPPVCAGLIGEIGVSKDFTDEERKVLRGAAQASARTGVPLMVHLPGWERLAHEVLDIAEQEGADLRHTVLCHMNPSLHDFEYQTSLADRGAFIEYDMIGMDYFYADQQAQSPSDEENAEAIKKLIDAGYIKHLLLSQDVFLKMMLTRYGGFGYGYILRYFVPRLRRHAVTDDQISEMLVENPRRVFADRS
jgi:phosphotriesterase-related protein